LILHCTTETISGQFGAEYQNRTDDFCLEGSGFTPKLIPLNTYIYNGDVMFLIEKTKKLLRQIGLLSPLSFDQQVWGAKSVIDLVQQGSKFLLAEGTNGGSTYTCWIGNNKIPTAVIVDSTGHATGPFADSSKIQDCLAWSYPAKITCAQAVINMAQAGISEAWITCRLRKTQEQTNPVYYFTFTKHSPVSVDATTGKII